MPQPHPTFAPPFRQFKMPTTRLQSSSVSRPAPRSSVPNLASPALLHDLRSRLEARVDTSYRDWHSRYLRYVTPVLGVRMGDIRCTVDEWVRENEVMSRMEVAEMKRLGLQMLTLGYEEGKLAGVLFLHEVLQRKGWIGPGDLEWMARAFEGDHGIADWNVCDWFAVKVMPGIVAMDGGRQGLREWWEATGVWKARCGLVGMLSLKDTPGGVDELLQGCAVLVARNERWAKTAVGWVLREVGKAERAKVRDFLQQHVQYVSVECVKNATKGWSDGERKSWVEIVKQAEASRRHETSVSDPQSSSA